MPTGPVKAPPVRPIHEVMVPLPALARRLAVVTAILLGAIVPVAPAHAFRLDPALTPLSGNPVEALRTVVPDPETYDPATHCDPRAKPGVTRLVRWLKADGPGEFWGSYRCETWGPHQASLHAEGRAIDWHLDGRLPSAVAAPGGSSSCCWHPTRPGPLTPWPAAWACRS